MILIISSCFLHNFCIFIFYIRIVDKGDKGLKGGDILKRLLLLLIVGVFSMSIAAGCSSSSDKEQKEMVLDPKHTALPDFVLNTSSYVQETYMMAAEHPDVVAAVPCYCNCNESAGHMSNMNCFIEELGPNNEVIKWDPHGTA